MNIFEWKASLSVGVPEFDDQHKHLIDLINELYQAMSTGQSDKLIDATLKELLTYGNTHFKSEEAIFHRYNYPGTDKHIAEHEEFLQKAADLYKAHTSGEKRVSIETLHFLRDWVTHHIKHTDMDYSSFLSKQLN